MVEPKILIVDDEPFNVDYLEQELAELAYVTISAANGQEALEKIHTESPDLVLLDIMMPVMDGFAVLTQLKADAHTRDIPVIVISANSDLKSVVRGIELGAEDYLPKPFEPTLLRARIATSLEKKHLRDLEQRYLKSMERELDIARRIQRSILPYDVPHQAGFEMGAKMAPARAVGGDFYDFIPLGKGKLGVVVGDVSDKGVPAALYMALTYSLLRAEARRAGSPVRVLQAVNRQLLEMAVTQMYVTVIYGVLDADAGRFDYARAGQPVPLALDHQGQRIPIQMNTGQPLGLLDNPLLDEQSLVLSPGAIVLLYSDGVTEAADPQENEFGEQHLEHALLALREKPAQSACEHLWQTVTDFCASPYAQDDITLLAIKRLE
jgi:phosphoserine phosphatase RsbU/P